jgi:lysophospholipase L1-like esterase
LPAVTEGQPEIEHADRPRWPLVGELAPATRRRTAVHVGARAGVGLLVAALLWWVGREIPAAILATVLVLLTSASLRFPAVAAAVDRVTWAIQRWAGRFLRIVLLGIVNLLIITPIAAVLRLVGHDPLALGLRPDATSFWRPVPQRRGRGAGAGLYRRPFAYEHAPPATPAASRLPFPRLRMALTVVAVLALLDVAVGSAINLVGGSDEPEPVSLLATPGVAAGRDEPWVKALGDEISALWRAKSYDPFLGWTMPDFRGRYVHVEDGVRRTAVPPPPATADPVDVFFFGGSTMFGSYQREDHTIPAEFARLAAADGVPVRVVNHGRMGYVNWQEVLQLEELVTGGSVPDLAVFYDGFNDLLSQFTLGPHDEPTHVGATEIDERLREGVQPGQESLRKALRREWEERSAVHRLARRLGLAEREATGVASIGSSFQGAQPDRPERRGVKAAAIHARGVDIARRLAGSYGFESAFFWQPSLYSKRVRPGEEGLASTLGADPRSWRAADRAARARLRAPVRDVGDALDPVRSPVMYDFVHTNEAGARAVARRLYEDLKPRLTRLAERARR